jgi:hypothetical protein
MRRKIFRQCRSTALQKTTRHSLPFWLGRSLAIPIFRRLKSALRFFIINYGFKTRSVNGFGCVIKYGLKSTAWFAFDCVINLEQGMVICRAFAGTDCEFADG